MEANNQQANTQQVRLQPQSRGPIVQRSIASSQDRHAIKPIQMKPAPSLSISPVVMPSAKGVYTVSRSVKTPVAAPCGWQRVCHHPAFNIHPIPKKFTILKSRKPSALDGRATLGFRLPQHVGREAVESASPSRSYYESYYESYSESYSESH